MARRLSRVIHFSLIFCCVSRIFAVSRDPADPQAAQSAATLASSAATLARSAATLARSAATLASSAATISSRIYVDPQAMAVHYSSGEARHYRCTATLRDPLVASLVEA